MISAAIRDAIAHDRIAVGQSIPAERAVGLSDPGTADPPDEKIGASLAEKLPAEGIAISGMATRICGAPHCKQNGLPSATL
jgi:hypothetical protein